jgi:hypothetical protein
VGDDPVEVLRRWEDAGGLWRVLDRRGESLTIGLFRCDGGEQVDELRSSSEYLLDFVGERASNID